MRYKAYGVIILLLFLIGGVVFMLIESTSKEVQPNIQDETVEEKILFGFIHEIKVQNGAYLIVFDDAAMLSGKEALDAAISAGDCTGTEQETCLPNDYYIQNENTNSVELRVHPNAQIIMETYVSGEPGVPEPISLVRFTDLINNNALHWKRLPYHITTLDGAVVTEIREQYIP